MAEAREDLNVPVQFQVILAFVLPDGDGPTFASDPQQFAVNPFEHDTPESFLADVQVSMRKIWKDTRDVFASPARADQLAAVVAAATEIYVNGPDDGAP